LASICRARCACGDPHLAVSLRRQGSGTDFAIAAYKVYNDDRLQRSGRYDEVNRGCTYTEDGFTLDFASPCLPSGEFRSIHPPSFRFNDSVSFFNNSQLGITRLTKTGGGSFDLASIDFGRLELPAADNGDVYRHPLGRHNGHTVIHHRRNVPCASDLHPQRRSTR